MLLTIIFWNYTEIILKLYASEHPKPIKLSSDFVKYLVWKSEDIWMGKILIQELYNFNI
jgi:hypothetical protein